MKLISRIKSGNAYAYLSDLRRYPQMLSFKKRYKALSNNAVILVGTPAHKNLGDHLIGVSELKFIRDCYPDNPLFEIPTHVFVRYENYIRSHAQKYAHVFITGGGWMGSVWPNEERTLQSMVDTFSESPLVILPQTIFYDTEIDEGKELHRSANEIFSKCKNLKLCVRDPKSVESAMTFEAIPSNRILLCPDIALYYADNYRYNSNDSRRLGLYLRKDREKVASDEALDMIKNYFKKNGYEFFVSDTMAEHLIPIDKREDEICRVIEDMKQCAVILTDRLHAMVYSVIAGVPCIALDNKTHKVQGVYSKWLLNNKNILFVGEDGCSEADISSFVQKGPQPFEAAYLVEEFKKLEQFIKEDN